MFADTDLGDMIISCLLMVLVPCLVFFTYRRLYKASRIGSSFAYGIFLVGMIFELIFDGVAALGWRNTGFLGIANGVRLMGEKEKLVGTMCIINGCLWILSFLFDLFLFITVRKSFNNAGGIKAFRKEALDETGKAVVGFVKEHPEEAKEAGRAIGKATVDYARENPDVMREVGRGAMSAATESAPLLH